MVQFIGIDILVTVVLGFILPLMYLPACTAKSVRMNDRLQSKQFLDSKLAESIRIDDVMAHLNELQRIATISNGTRAVNTPGFNHTLDYLTNYLSANTNFKIMKQYFHVRSFALARSPILLSSIGGRVTNHTYSNNLSVTDFFQIQYSTSANFSNFIPLTAIPNLGCSDADWRAVNPPVTGRIALVKRGECTFAEKGTFAAKYNATAILVYNDGVTPDRTEAIYISLGQSNAIPALFLSFDLGQQLANAAQNPANNAGVRIHIAVTNDRPFPVGNICAHTPTGDPTQTILIGSHSDGVPEGPGINDNGSGSAANLAWAVALARLFRMPTYSKYKYRVRFCWWGAEELGLLGSAFHAAEARNSTVVGERIKDYLINLNFDMLGSPNFMFGIYDGRTARNDTPPSAIPGSNKISELFRNWFNHQNLPWDWTEFSGRSDYGPFLAEGIVAGGLSSGADDIKDQEQRDRYDRLLGQGQGGIAGVIHDPCYHQACDSIQNINLFGYEKLVQAAAYAIENLARQPDLKTWLYPERETQRIASRRLEQRQYDSINDYFRMPYF